MEAPAAAGCKARTWGDGVPSPGQPPASAKADTDPQPPHLTDFGMLPWARASCPARPSVAAHQASMGRHSEGGLGVGGVVRGEAGVGGGGGAD